MFRSALCFGGLEPECPFGSPSVRLADAEGRCERFWECDDGMISDIFCPSGEGFDPQTQKCSLSAACLKDSVAKPPPNGLSGIVELLTPK